jgi:hypothetical protein
MHGQADGAQHALRRLWPSSLACRPVVGQVFSLSWPHVAAVALHSAIDVKCTRRIDCLRELRLSVSIDVLTSFSQREKGRCTSEQVLMVNFRQPSHESLIIYQVRKRMWFLEFIFT